MTSMACKVLKKEVAVEEVILAIFSACSAWGVKAVVQVRKKPKKGKAQARSLKSLQKMLSTENSLSYLTPENNFVMAAKEKEELTSANVELAKDKEWLLRCRCQVILLFQVLECINNLHNLVLIAMVKVWLQTKKISAKNAMEKNNQIKKHNQKLLQSLVVQTNIVIFSMEWLMNTLVAIHF